MLSDRTEQCAASIATTDRFFDRWLPVFVDEVRGLLRGHDIARTMHQEVVSKDGISRPVAPSGPPAAGLEPKWNPGFQPNESVRQDTIEESASA